MPIQMLAENMKIKKSLKHYKKATPDIPSNDCK